jgi:tetratricopeptide (TPR) repeat protein
MGTHDHGLRLWQRIAIAFTFFVAFPVTVYTQSSPNDTTASSDQVVAVIERIRAKPSDAERVAEAHSFGLELLRAGRYEDALGLFSAMLDVLPGDRQSLYGSALALFNLHRLSEAERLARAAVAAPGPAQSTTGEVKKRHEQTADALVLLGVILAVKGDNATAQEMVAKAVALAPGNFDAQFALGRARYGAGDPAGAASAFRAAVSLKPDDAQARFFLATALERATRYDEAMAAYHELLTIHPDSAAGHLGLGVLLIKLGGAKTDLGITELVRAIALNGDLYEARVTLGRTLVRAGRAAEALDHLRRAAVLAPGNPEPHYQLALAYRRLGRTAEAAEESTIVQKLHAARRGTSADSGMSSNNQD